MTRGEGRKFGLTVGVAFLALGALSWWRGHVIPPVVLASVGGLLALAALVVPGQLGPVHRVWMALAQAISKVTTPLFMGLVYFGIITPTALLMRALGRNPLMHGERDGGFWTAREPGARQSGSMERQF